MVRVRSGMERGAGELGVMEGPGAPGQTGPWAEGAWPPERWGALWASRHALYSHDPDSPTWDQLIHLPGP